MLEQTFQQPQVLMGATGAVIGFLALTAAVAVFSMHLMKKNADSLRPDATDVQVTMAKEGELIRWVCGRRKISGNIVDSGPPITVEIKPDGGKGLGGNGGGATGGTQTFMDIWQGLCRVGPLGLARANLIDTYISQTPKALQATDIVFNDGINGFFPTFFATAGPRPGIVHIGLQRLFLGENVNSVPNLQFVIEKVSLGPIPSANLANGTNPAAEIYDILIETGTDPADINLPAFFTAAAFWAARGYGINLDFVSKSQGKDAIETIVNYVDGVYFRNNEGKHTIRALDKNDASVATITDKEIKDFAVNRKDWEQVPNKLRANFIDEDKDYTQRSIVIENPAAIRMAGKEVGATLDYKAFRDLTTAAKRLAENAKRICYPVATYKFKTYLKYVFLQPGDVFTLDFNRNYGGQVLQFTQRMRVTRRTEPGIDSVEIEIEAEELVEEIHDDDFLVQGGSDAERVELTPIALNNVTLYELPYNKVTLDSPAYVVFANREKGFETAYDVYVSTDMAQDYEKVKTLTTFSMHGTLAANYADDTYQIDDEVGIEFTPTNLNDTFITVSRERFFAYDRLVLLNGELMAFEKVETLGNSNIKLTGLARGVYNTPIQNHTAGDDVYITTISNNILDNVDLAEFYVKIVPKFLGNTVNLSAVTPILVTATGVAREPYTPGRLIATRTGSTIELQIVPRTPGVPGAGDVFTSETDSEPPYNFNGLFLVSYGAVVDQAINVDSLTINEPAAVTISVKSKLNNKISSAITVFVDTSNGEYIS